MAKRRRVKRVRRTARKIPDNRRLSMLLLMLALAVFVFAAVMMTKGGI
ncbi:MAG: hypothetical protein NTZ07_00760 [Candidatus Woesebacteria bacterium]|jgi:hypothetical protein|nr:hypothetical protein [Candidatus Woesebacteria bacterium]